MKRAISILVVAYVVFVMSGFATAVHPTAPEGEIRGEAVWIDRHKGTITLMRGVVGD